MTAEGPTSFLKRRYEDVLREITNMRTCKLCYAMPRERWCGGCLAAEALGIEEAVRAEFERDRLLTRPTEELRDSVWNQLGGCVEMHGFVSHCSACSSYARAVADLDELVRRADEPGRLRALITKERDWLAGYPLGMGGDEIAAYLVRVFTEALGERP